jgi:HPt (histidine-containing phosphotransfer) domain-containing protein
MEPASPPVDVAQGLERHGSREFWCELAGIYLEEAPKRLESIRQALKAGDLTIVGDEAHGLKGSALEMVALPLRDACMNLERAARAGEVDRLEPLLGSMLREYERVREYMNTELAIAPVEA